MLLLNSCFIIWRVFKALGPLRWEPIKFGFDPLIREMIPSSAAHSALAHLQCHQTGTQPTLPWAEHLENREFYPQDLDLIILRELK